jgi:hypothetical protein
MDEPEMVELMEELEVGELKAGDDPYRPGQTKDTNRMASTEMILTLITTDLFSCSIYCSYPYTPGN